MALIDYRKLCPRSGHVLTREERNALPASFGAQRAAIIRCEDCGRDVTLIVHPGTGRSLIYPMHVKCERPDGRGASGKGPPTS